jgi:hypothetical protein
MLSSDISMLMKNKRVFSQSNLESPKDISNKKPKKNSPCINITTYPEHHKSVSKSKRISIVK